jgi:hypothetical protein
MIGDDSKQDNWINAPVPHSDPSECFEAQHGRHQDRGYNTPQNARQRICSISRASRPFDLQAQDNPNTARHPAGRHNVLDTPILFIQATSTRKSISHQAQIAMNSSFEATQTTDRGPSISRPMTPSAIPRPTSMMSLPGTRTPLRTASRSSTRTLDHESSTPTHQSFVPLGRASPSSQRLTRSVSGPAYGLQAGVPPVPALLSRQELAAKEALRASCLSSFPQGPSSHAAAVTYRSFFQGARSVSLTSSGSPRTGATEAGLRNALGSPSRVKSPPSSFKFPPTNTSRPSSSMSSRAGAITPMSAGLGGAFEPNPLDELDKELARVLESFSTDVSVERVDPPLRKGQLHVGEWKAQYAFTIYNGRKVHSCRLLELTRSGGNNGNKTRKVMIRNKGGQRRFSLPSQVRAHILICSVDRLATILSRQM